MNSQRMTIRQLMAAREYFRENPSGVIRLKGVWPERDLNREQWAAWFAGCLNAKINSHTSSYGRGRNWAADQFWRFYRDAQAIRARIVARVRVYQFETAQARARFSYLLARNDD